MSLSHSLVTDSLLTQALTQTQLSACLVVSPCLFRVYRLECGPGLLDMRLSGCGCGCATPLSVIHECYYTAPHKLGCAYLSTYVCMYVCKHGLTVGRPGRLLGCFVLFVLFSAVRARCSLCCSTINQPPCLRVNVLQIKSLKRT